MAHEAPSPISQEHSHDERLEQVLSEYLRQLEEGLPVEPHILIAAHPELADDLREFFVNHDRMLRLAAPILASAPEQGAPTRLRSPVAQVGLALGPYTLEQELGQGGMGEVWVAKQSTPVKRRVALKLIRYGLPSKEVLTRFEQERQALAMMDHPNIAKVFDGGSTSSGQPYFVMELVNGLPLTRFCDDARLTPRERLQLFVPICQAVQHAHQKGVVHRDLKPSNILVTIYDGQPVPKIIDFGVAKAIGGNLSEESLYTTFGTVVGTLEYMSPEQTGFNARDIDTRADIYSLGVILYELLTGLRPMDGFRLRRAALTEMIRVIQEEEPTRPSTRLSSDAALPSLAALRQVDPKRLTALLRGELDWIVMKCLEKSRDRRYETANGLARDIQNYLADEPVEARPPSTTYRLRKFLRRNQGPVLSIFLLLLALIGGIIGTTWGLLGEAAQRKIAEFNEGKAKQAAQQERIAKETAIAAGKLEREERDRADENFKQVEHKTKLLRQALYFSDMKLVQSAWEAGQFGTMANLLDRYDPPSEGEDLRGFEWWYWNRLSHDQKTLLGHQGNVNRVAFSLDRKRIFSVSADDTVQIWDAVTNKSIASHRGFPGNVLEFSRDGLQIAASPGDSTVALWHTTSGRKTQTLKGQSQVSSLTFSPDGLRIAVGGNDTVVTVWDLKTGQEVQTLRGHTKKVGCLAYSLDGSRIASSSDDRTVKIWDVATSHECATFLEQDNNCMALSPNGKQLAVEKEPGSIQVWDIDTAKLLHTCKGHSDYIWALAFSPDGTSLASASEDKTIKVWNTTTGAESCTFKGHADVVSCLAFSSDGLRIVSGSDDRTLKHWNAVTEDGTLTVQANTETLAVSYPAPHSISDPMKHVLSIGFSPDGKQLVAGSYDRTVTLWDTSNGNKIRTLDGHAGSVFGVAFSPDGALIASASSDGKLKLWDSLTGQERFSREGPVGYSLRSVAFSSDGKQVASAGTDVITLWDTNTGEELRTINRLSTETSPVIRSIALSPNGKRLVTGGEGTLTNIWDVTTGQLVHSLSGHTGAVLSVAYSPDGTQIATASADRSVKLWDAASGQESLTHKMYEHLISSVAFTPDGKRIVVGSGDQFHLRMGDLIEGDHPGELTLWDVETGQETLTLKGHTRPIICIAVSRNGEQIASSGFDGTIRFWRAPRQIALKSALGKQ